MTDAAATPAPKKTVVQNVWIGFLKSFRGLICEKKDGEWEMSKGNAAFWVVLGHCMWVWNQASNVASKATDAITTEGAMAAVAAVAKASDIPEYEFYTLMALLAYAGVKVAKDGMNNVTDIVSAWKGGGAKE